MKIEGKLRPKLNYFGEFLKNYFTVRFWRLFGKWRTSKKMFAKARLGAEINSRFQIWLRPLIFTWIKPAKAISKFQQCTKCFCDGCGRQTDKNLFDGERSIFSKRKRGRWKEGIWASCFQRQPDKIRSCDFIRLMNPRKYFFISLRKNTKFVNVISIAQEFHAVKQREHRGSGNRNKRASTDQQQHMCWHLRSLSYAQ